MAAPRYGPCGSWLTVDEARARSRCGDDDPPTDEQFATAIAVASEVLFDRSGRQFPGECEATVRPCRRCSAGMPTWWESSIGGFVSTAPWGTCGCEPTLHSKCGCGSVHEIVLGGWPLVSIDEVRVDGAVLDPSAYRIDDYAYLVRIDGDGWPACQRLDLDDTESGTFAVDYTYGRPVPEGGLQAAADLACGLARGMAGGDCKLPQRVSTVSRQGVTMATLDAFTFLDRGRTGIYTVDLWLSAVNPAGRSRRGTVASPDIGPAARRVGT